MKELKRKGKYQYIVTSEVKIFSSFTFKIKSEKYGIVCVELSDILGANRHFLY